MTEEEKQEEKPVEETLNEVEVKPGTDDAEKVEMEDATAAAAVPAEALDDVIVAHEEKKEDDEKNVEGEDNQKKIMKVAADAPWKDRYVFQITKITTC